MQRKCTVRDRVAKTHGLGSQRSSAAPVQSRCSCRCSGHQPPCVSSSRQAQILTAAIEQRNNLPLHQNAVAALREERGLTAEQQMGLLGASYFLLAAFAPSFPAEISDHAPGTESSTRSRFWMRLNESTKTWGLLLAGFESGMEGASSEMRLNRLGLFSLGKRCLKPGHVRHLGNIKHDREN